MMVGSCFLLGPGLFSGAMLVLGMVEACECWHRLSLGVKLILGKRMICRSCCDRTGDRPKFWWMRGYSYETLGRLILVDSLFSEEGWFESCSRRQYPSVILTTLMFHAVELLGVTEFKVSTRYSDFIDFWLPDHVYHELESPGTLRKFFSLDIRSRGIKLENLPIGVWAHPSDGTSTSSGMTETVMI